jgi:hypothetical protein
MFAKKSCCIGAIVGNMFSAKTQNRILTAIVIIDVIGFIILCYLNKGWICG